MLEVSDIKCCTGTYNINPIKVGNTSAWDSQFAREKNAISTVTILDIKSEYTNNRLDHTEYIEKCSRVKNIFGIQENFIKIKFK